MIKNESHVSLETFNLKLLIRTFLIFFLPSAALIGVTITLVYYNDIQFERKIIENREKNVINLGLATLKLDIKSIVSDLTILSDHFERKWTPDNKVLKREELELTYLSFSNRKQSYDQIRYLNEFGMEVVRINFNEGNPSIVPQKQLQNKANRYYFRDAFKIKKGEVYISPFDLNIERGKIERPISDKIDPRNPVFNNIWRIGKNNRYAKPMIRFATPVFDHSGHSKGIVLINYFGARILNNYETTTISSHGRCLLLNADGYWLKGPTRQKEWGFMEELFDGDIHTFKSEFPEAWQQVNRKESGQFYTKKGLFTHKTVYLLEKGQVSSSGSGKAFDASNRTIDEKAYSWKILTFVPSSVFSNTEKTVRRNYALVFVVLILLLLVFSWFWTTSKKHEQVKKQYGTLLKVIAQPIYSLDHKGNFVFINSVFAKQLQGKPKNIAGKKLTDFFEKESAKKHLKSIQEAINKSTLISLASELEINNQKRWFDIRIQPYRDKDKERDEALVILTDITDRKTTERKLEQIQNDLIEKAHKAGMAEIATDTLHNVGNILNSVKTSTHVVKEIVRTSPLLSYSKACELMRENTDNLAAFIHKFPQGKILFDYLLILEDEFRKSFDEINQNIDQQNEKIEIISDIIIYQQRYAGTEFLKVDLKMEEVIDESLDLVSEFNSHKGIVVEKNLNDVPEIKMPKTKLIHTLVNIFRNAGYSLAESDEDSKIIKVNLERIDDKIILKIADNGIGIEKKNLEKIFSHGFTTRKHGSGFGLHSCATYLQDMGAEIEAFSEGPGKGATFEIRFHLPT